MNTIPTDKAKFSALRKRMHRELEREESYRPFCIEQLVLQAVDRKKGFLRKELTNTNQEYKMMAYSELFGIIQREIPSRSRSLKAVSLKDMLVKHIGENNLVAYNKKILEEKISDPEYIGKMVSIYGKEHAMSVRAAPAQEGKQFGIYVDGVLMETYGKVPKPL